MKRTQISVGNFTYYYYPFTYFLDSMERLGIGKIELWAAQPHFYFGDFNYAQTSQLARTIRERHLQVCCVTPEQYLYPVNIASLNTDTRKRSIQYFKRAIDVAAEMEAPKVLVASGHCCIGENREESEKRMEEALAELAHSARFKGVQVVLEPMPRQIDLIRRAREVKVLLDSIGFYEGIHGMMDMDICLRTGDTPGNFIRELGIENFSHVHLNDGNPGGHLVPGDGKLPVKEALKELDVLGYEGDISVEVTNAAYYEKPEEAIRKTLDWLECI